MKRFIIIIVVLISIILSLCTSCSVITLVNTINAGVKPPIWSNTVTIPVFTQSQNLEDVIVPSNLPLISTVVDPAAPFTKWPVPDVTMDVAALFTPVVISGFPLDLNDDGTDDLQLKGFRSLDTRIYIRLSLEDVDDPGVLLKMDPSQVDITSVVIEGMPVNFTGPIWDPYNKELIFVSTDFPLASNDYFFDFGGDSGADYTTIAIDSFTLSFFENTDDATTCFPAIIFPGGYLLNIDAEFSVGSSFEIAGVIDNTVDVFTVEDQSLPMDLISGFITKLKPFGVYFDVESRLPLNMRIEPSFAASDMSSDLVLLTSSGLDYIGVNNGVMGYRSLIGPSPDFGYVSGKRSSSSLIATDLDIMSIGSITMGLTVKLLPSANIVFISPSDGLNMKLSITGGATISLEELFASF